MPATAMTYPNPGFGRRNDVLPSPPAMVPRIANSFGFSVTFSVWPRASVQPGGGTGPSKRRPSPMIARARTLSGIGSADAGTSTPACGRLVFAVDEATPGSAWRTWRPPQPANSTAAAAPTNGARFKSSDLSRRGSVLTREDALQGDTEVYAEVRLAVLVRLAAADARHHLRVHRDRLHPAAARRVDEERRRIARLRVRYGGDLLSRVRRIVVTARRVNVGGHLRLDVRVGFLSAAF